MSAFTSFGAAQRLYEAAIAASCCDLPGDVAALLDAAVKQADACITERVHCADQIEDARKLATDELEVDDTPFVSIASDGVWVSAWLWIPAEEE